MTHHYALYVKCGVVEFYHVGKMGLLLTWKKDNSLRDDPNICECGPFCYLGWLNILDGCIRNAIIHAYSTIYYLSFSREKDFLTQLQF
jgi:hypothetical protein